MPALVLFGGGGDLAMRMLLPSLYFLEYDGLLPDGLKIIGAARSGLEGREEYHGQASVGAVDRARRRPKMPGPRTPGPGSSPGIDYVAGRRHRARSV